MEWLQQSDFDCVGLVAKHCNLEKLCIAEKEAFEFDLRELLCEQFFDVEENWGSEGEYNDDFNDDFYSGVPADWAKILNGTDWIGCNGKKRRHKGLKTLLAYLTYARYILINNYDDTASGGVNKTAEFTIPKPLAELKDFSSKYRKMALSLWSDIEAYLCSIGWSMKNCKGCGCNGSCGKGIGTKGYGGIVGNVTKYN